MIYEHLLRTIWKSSKESVPDNGAFGLTINGGFVLHGKTAMHTT